MNDAIEKAIKAIWADMTDRRGIKWELTGCEPQFQEEIREVWRKNMRKVAAAAAEQERERIAGEMSEAVDTVTKHVGCGDNSCLFVKPTGMATNGGCRCCGRDGGHRPFVPAALARLYKATLKIRSCLRAEKGVGK